MQISGHTHVESINKYSTMSEERHKKISSIPSNTETNRNALVLVVSNLPRTTSTSTNYITSSTSDVSCRSNPDVPSYCANTNMSSEISSTCMLTGQSSMSIHWLCTQIPITDYEKCIYELELVSRTSWIAG